MLAQYLDYKFIPYIGTAFFVLVAALIFIYILTVQVKQKRLEELFDKQLQYSTNEGESEIPKEAISTRALKNIPRLMIKAEMTKMNEDELNKKMLMYSSFGFVIGSILMRNLLGGLIPIFLIYGGILIVALFKLNKKKALMNEQIPAFISTFKANIQANQHAQNAMVNAINNTASPLYDELARAKAIMEAGDFKPGIIALRKNSENELLRQLAACIELASSSGSNIEEQIEIIEEIIKDKQSIERKKKLGVNENKPLFFVASAFVPLSFIGSWFLSDMHRSFWFQSALSYGIIIGVIITMIISCWATWKVIKKVDIG